MWREDRGPELGIAGKVLPFDFGSNTDPGAIVMASRHVREMDTVPMDIDG